MYYSFRLIYLFYICLLFLSLISLKMDDKCKKRLLFLQAISTAIFFGLRDVSVGTDTSTYVNAYLAQSNWLDIGLTVTNKIIYLYAGSSWKLYLITVNLMISINLALAYSIIFKSSFKYVNLAYWALYSMPYMMLMQINIMRQGLALSLVILGFLLLIFCGRKKIGILLLLIGCLVHYSMFFICLGFVAYRFLKINYAYTILLIVFFLAISLTGVSNGVLNFFSEWYVAEKFLVYLEREPQMGFLIKYLFYLSNFVVMIFFSVRIKDAIYDFFCKFGGFLLIASSFIYASELMANRLLLSFDFIVPIIYFYPYKYIREKKVYAAVMVVGVLIYFFYVINSYSLRYNFRI